MRRHAFTLVELLVSIAVIGVLAMLALGAMQKAQTRAKAIKTQSTIAKLHQQILTKWESYKFRRLPVDPRLLLQSGGSAYLSGQISAMVAKRAGQFPAGSTDPLTIANSTAQLAAVKLIALRELQRYELPTGFSEIIDTDAAGNWQGAPGAWNVRPPLVLLTVPQLAQAYVQKINMARTPSGAIPTQQQLQTYDAAECLYMIVKMACEEENNALADSLKDVGDADGDGLPEFQDGFAGMNQAFAANGAANNPIMWNRWPAGFTNYNRGDAAGNFIDSLHFSDFQDDPANLIEKAPGGALQVLQSIQGQPSVAVFSQNNHDYFDPMRLDAPGNSGQPRGYQLTPLIYSAGVDSIYGIVPSAWNDGAYSLNQQNALINDPYAADSQNRRSGSWHTGNFVPSQGVMDDFTNHIQNAR